MGIGRYFLRARPFIGREAEFVKTLERLLPKKDFEKARTLLKELHCRPGAEEVHSTLFGTITIPQVEFSTSEARAETRFLNEQLWSLFIAEQLRELGENAFDKIVELLAPHIVGLEMIKRSCILQLFSDRVHILLLGDPGTGKTDILRAIAEFSPISSYGLGSGTSGVGLVTTMKGNEIKPGLLPMADGGICIIDELNLLKEESRAGLYNAMEKGFVTYDKGGHHEQLPARVRILASANPIGEKFRGGSANALRRQLPLDSALLSRFHLFCIIRRPSAEEFGRIASSAASRKAKEPLPGDREIIKKYCSLVRGMNPAVSKEVQEEIVKIASSARENEEELLVEITPRTVHGLLDLARASARIVGRNEVTMLDVVRAKEVFTKSLEYGGNTEE